MLKKIIEYCKGYVKIQIVGYSPERFLNLCKNKGIELWGLESKHGAYEMFLTVKDFKGLKPILRKTNTKVVIQKRYGVPFFLFHYRKRKCFFLSWFLCPLIIYLFSLCIWNIDVAGNTMITDEVLIEFLKGQDVYHGMKRSHVDCDEIRTKIRKNFQEIIWVSVSLEGSNLYIHVKENTDSFETSKQPEEPCDIIADNDGVIVEMVTRAGTPLVSPGDTVKSGDTLVSSVIEVKNDAGEVIRNEEVHADADVTVEYILPYEHTMQKKHFVKEYDSSKQIQYVLTILDCRFTFGIRKHRKEQYELGAECRQLTIGQNFELPITISKVQGRSYEMVEKEYSAEELEELEEEHLNHFLSELMEEGCEVVEQHIVNYNDTNGIRTKGYLKIRKQVGSPRKKFAF